MTDRQTIGVIGLGAMGLGIAQVFAKAGYNVVVTDQVEAARQSALSRIRASLQPRVEAGKMEAVALETLLSKISVVDEEADFASCSLVIEAIIEDLSIKTALFEKLEKHVAKDCILATNTSSLSVEKIATALSQPERFLGLHFFNPAPVMKLVELVKGEQTSCAALAKVQEIMTPTGKTVIPCADRPGFIVNRCARPFYGEALALLEEGRSASDIDAAMIEAGFKMGPFSLIDLVGADINLAATESLFAAMDNSPRYHIFDSLKKQVAAGNLGRKTGKGFLFPEKPGEAPADHNEISNRILAMLLNEAATLLEESDLEPDQIDLALKLGLNFPYGPFEKMREVGLDTLLETLQHLQDKAPDSLKDRYKITPILKSLG